MPDLETLTNASSTNSDVPPSRDVPTPILAAQPWDSEAQQAWALPAPETYGYKLTIIPAARLKGKPTEFRRIVTLRMNENGIALEGKAVPTGWRYVLGYLIGGVLIAEFAMQRQKTLEIPWSDVEAIRLDPAKKRGVVCYHLPNKPKALYSLGFKTTDQPTFDHFDQMARSFMPAKVETGKVKMARLLMILLIIYGAILLTAFLVATLLPPPKH